MTTLLRGLYALRGPEGKDGVPAPHPPWFLEMSATNGLGMDPGPGPNPTYVVMWVMFLSLGDRKQAGYIWELKASPGQMRLCLKNKRKGKSAMAQRKL